MSSLDGKQKWIYGMRDVPRQLKLKYANPVEFRRLDRCESAQKDFQHLAATNRKFTRTGMKMIATLRNFERGAPIKVIIPTLDFPAPGAMIYRAPRRFLEGWWVTETLLLPCRTGLLQAGFWHRKLGTYDLELQQAHIHRIGCYLRYWDINPPKRGSVFGEVG